MSADLAVQALSDAIDRPQATLTVASVNWDRFYPTFALARPRPFLHEITEVMAYASRCARALHRRRRS
ncbi:type I polyketide synthase loading module domain protein [Mycobacterium ulcerans str. Harvey]|uniref:Type I polyketide synthase loading module domain protein n=1 Tax=Mycobacterium ulcerans str. Harvey TaxID=1299332 RepID=A0ABP3AWA1_MYCUL|nr:type I polyketide synthase loading module domain protein [Mycobacterium ulcerans str. Harvey]